jgi:hypothetical protein
MKARVTLLFCVLSASTAVANTNWTVQGFPPNVSVGGSSSWAAHNFFHNTCGGGDTITNFDEWPVAMTTNGAGVAASTVTDGAGQSCWHTDGGTGFSSATYTVNGVSVTVHYNVIVGAKTVNGTTWTTTTGVIQGDYANPNNHSHIKGRLNVSANDAKTHTLALKVGGVIVASTGPTSANSNMPQSLVIDYTGTVAEGVQWKWVVDGADFGSGGTVAYGGCYSCDPVVPAGDYYASDVMSVPASANSTGATPTPVANSSPPVPAPTAQPSPVAQGTPPTVTPVTAPSGSGTVLGQNVIVDNPNDFYDPIKRAVADSGNGIPFVGNANPTHETSNYDERGTLDDLQGGMDTISADVTQVRDGMIGQVQALITQIGTLPTSLGSVTTIDMPLNSIASAASVGITLPSGIDLTRFSSIIALLRLVLLWLLRIAAFVQAIRLFTWTN